MDWLCYRIDRLWHGSSYGINIPSNEMDGKKVGTQGYMKRYLFYGFILVLCHYLDFNLIGVLIGMMCNKGAILIYALIERKGLHE